MAGRCNFDNGLEPKPSFAVARYAPWLNRGIRSGSGHLRPDRDVDLSSHPEAMEEDGKLAGDANYCSLLRCPPGAGASETPAAKVGVWSAEPEDVVGAVDQQLAEVFVTGP